MHRFVQRSFVRDWRTVVNFEFESSGNYCDAAVFDFGFARNCGIFFDFDCGFTSFASP